MTNTLRPIGLLVLLAALGSMPALAVNVQYNTTGAFTTTDAGCNATVSTVLACPGTGLAITYGNTVGNTVAPPFPTNATFGQFTTTGPTLGQSQTLSASHFSLSIHQSVPGAGNQVLSDTFDGTVSLSNTGGSSNIELDFTTAPGAVNTTFHGQEVWKFNLSGVTYYVDEFTEIPPSTTGCTGAPGGPGCGVTTINGFIDASALPEPTFYGLTGVGFAGLLLMAIRRNAQRKVS